MRYVIEIMMEQPDDVPRPGMEEISEAVNAAGRNLPGKPVAWNLRGASTY